MKTIFIIGGIGSGKSEVTRRLADLDVRMKLTDLDILGHKALEDKRVIAALVELFGEEILDAQGKIVRGRLAEKTFGSSESVSELEAVTFPKIAELLEQKRADLPQNAILLVEASSYNPDKESFTIRPDMLVAVTADEETRIKRAVSKGFEEADVQARNARQPTDAQRTQWADFVIENNGTEEELQQKVTKLGIKLLKNL